MRIKQHACEYCGNVNKFCNPYQEYLEAENEN
jgi:hypothetical protein